MSGYNPTFSVNELQKEIWKPVSGFEGYYSVSNLGRVRRDKAGNHTNAGRLRSLKPTKRGYVRLSFWRDSSVCHFFIHQLVATLFIGDCPPNHTTNHIDGVKTNNRVSNLEYLTPKGQMEHAKSLGLVATGDRTGARRHPERRARGDRNGTRTHPEITRGENNPRALFTNEQVRAIKRRLAAGESHRALADEFKVRPYNIYRIASGKNYSHVKTD
jgi:hypothetical protein